ncbi:hypothetical protein CPB83DRAFT_900904, partial [Crepidotus variabilis]
MDHSPVSRVSYRPYPSTPIEKVTYTAGESSELVSPQRRPRQRGYTRAKRPSTRAHAGNSPTRAIRGLTPSSNSTTYDLLHPDNTDTTSNLSPQNTDSRFRNTSPLRPTLDEAYLVFLEAVSSGECAFYQLNQVMFVANGWNIHKSEAHGWYHLQSASIGLTDTVTVVCMCPEYRNRDHCFHQRFLLDYGKQTFPVGHLFNENPSSTILFSRVKDVLLEDAFINHFSVASHLGHNTVKNRVIVDHHGDDKGGGSWNCARDPS